MERMKELEEKSIFILREAKAKFRKPAVLWSTGKDSTSVLWLCRKAFMGIIPFPVIHIDTGRKFPEIYAFRDALAKEWGFDLKVIRNEKALAAGIAPEKGRFECCTVLKTETLKSAIRENGFDAVIVSIRRDEHGIRAKERVFSPRDAESRWDYKDQPPELWEIYVPGAKSSHVRVHPILHWSELDTWQYMEREGIPPNPLYFSKGGKRYRSLGCVPCTVPVASGAKTVREIVKELKTTRISERSGRSQDKEKEYMMQKLRTLGYL
ncbi:MAG: sulfate adenylyltransferase subunit CysD [Endomicrobiales bacterium]